MMENTDVYHVLVGQLAQLDCQVLFFSLLTPSNHDNNVLPLVIPLGLPQHHV